MLRWRFRVDLKFGLEVGLVVSQSPDLENRISIRMNTKNRRRMDPEIDARIFPATDAEMGSDIGIVNRYLMSETASEALYSFGLQGRGELPSRS